MSRTVHLIVSDEAYECALYLARVTYKDTTWVFAQWLHHTKDESLQNHDGLRQHIERWRSDRVREYQRSLIEPDLDGEDEPPF